MAKNTGQGRRRGSISGETQSAPRHVSMWTRPNTSSGLFMKSPKLGGSLRGVRRPWWRRLLDVFRWET